MIRQSPFEFVQSSAIDLAPTFESNLETSLKLDQLPDGVVAGNTLIDYSATASEEIRSAVSLAMVFAGRVATKQVGKDAAGEDWLAAYQTSLGSLGFSLQGTAMQRARFSKKGLFVHKAIIPFLTIALGGAGVGPVILAALTNLQEMDKDRPWVTLFDRQSRRHESSELHFAAISSDTSTTTIRQVVARLTYQSTNTNILFFKVDDLSAEFDSATTHIIGNNLLLTSLAPRLLDKMKGDVGDYIAGIGDV